MTNSYAASTTQTKFVNMMVRNLCELDVSPETVVRLMAEHKNHEEGVRQREVARKAASATIRNQREIELQPFQKELRRECWIRFNC